VLQVLVDAAQDAFLDLKVELTRSASSEPGALPSRQAIAAHVRRHLERLNSEFANYVPASRREPHVELRPFEDAEYFPRGVKHRYTRH
jgi:phenylacetate-CoA ligase